MLSNKMPAGQYVDMLTRELDARKVEGTDWADTGSRRIVIQRTISRPVANRRNFDSGRLLKLTAEPPRKKGFEFREAEKNESFLPRRAHLPRVQCASITPGRLRSDDAPAL